MYHSFGNTTLFVDNSHITVGKQLLCGTETKKQILGIIQASEWLSRAKIQIKGRSRVQVIQRVNRMIKKVNSGRVVLKETVSNFDIHCGIPKYTEKCISPRSTERCREICLVLIKIKIAPHVICGLI